jgi:pimeloyl-ACP methyl ester carboxylesterase
MVDSIHIRRLAHALNASNISFVAFDLDHHGLSMNGYPGCCRGNLLPLTRSSRHALEMAVRAASDEPTRDLVVLGHSIGAGIAMLAMEGIHEMLPSQLKGAVLIAPGNHADCEVFFPRTGRQLRWCCCPCLYCAGRCLCPCCYMPGRAATAQRQGVPGEPNYGAERTWLAPCCLFYLPEEWGGLPDATWWGAHHAGVRHIFVRCEHDQIIMPRSVEMLRDAADGAFERWEVGHEFLTDVDENGNDVDWRRWLARTVTLVDRYLKV